MQSSRGTVNAYRKICGVYGWFWTLPQTQLTGFVGILGGGNEKAQHERDEEEVKLNTAGGGAMPSWP